jgi:hypothetical protein
MNDRFSKIIIGVIIAAFIARSMLDGWLAYKAQTDSPKTIDAPTCIVRLVKS